MFLLFINKLKEISAYEKQTLLFPAAASLPHQVILARCGVIVKNDFDLATLLTEYGFSLERVAEDPTVARLQGLTGQQFFTLGKGYRQKLAALIGELRAQDSDQTALSELDALYNNLAVYEQFSLQTVSALSPHADDSDHAATCQRVQELFGNKPLADDGLPELSRTNWPENRDKIRYLQLHYPRLFRDRANPDLMLLLTWLRAKHVIVDAGIGNGLALAQLHSADNVTIGYSLHSVDEANVNHIDGLCYSPIPDGQQARAAFERLRGSVDLVIDTYGPSTYAKQTIHALIYLGLLLRQGGKAKIIISSVLGEERDQSPIGFADTRKQLINFFKNELDLEMVITRTFVNSAVHHGVVCQDFHLGISRSLTATARREPLDELLSVADLKLGKPQPIPKTTIMGNFQNGYKIQGMSYTLDGSVQLQAYHWQDALSAVNMDYVLQEGVGIRFHLQFAEQVSCSQFSIQFSEFFVFHPNPDWQITQHDEETIATIVYFDKVIDERVIKYQFGSMDGGWHCVYNEKTGARPTTMTLPVFDFDDIAYCVQQAREQLQASMEIPGIEKVDASALHAEQTPISIFKRHAAEQLTLFKPADTKREVNRFYNQYVHAKI